MAAAGAGDITADQVLADTAEVIMAEDLITEVITTITDLTWALV